VPSNWAINGANSGTLTGVGGTFTNIQNLTGATNTDTFVFAAGGSVSGTVDGGANTNTIDLNAKVGAVSINLQTGAFTRWRNVHEHWIVRRERWNGRHEYDANWSERWRDIHAVSSNTGTVGAANFSGVGSLVGGTGNDTLRATSATWTLNGSNQGTVTNLAAHFLEWKI